MGADAKQCPQCADSRTRRPRRLANVKAMATTTPLHTTVESPIGELLLFGDGAELHGLYILGGPLAVPVAAEWERDDRAFDAARSQLGDYFARTRTEFELDLAPAGTPFQHRVWSALERIPLGETITYAELARRIGRPGAARAVGMANARNPISIVVPCHRVIGADGELTGYGGGIERKRMLLELEACPAAKQKSPRRSGGSSKSGCGGV